MPTANLYEPRHVSIFSLLVQKHFSCRSFCRSRNQEAPMAARSARALFQPCTLRATFRSVPSTVGMCRLFQSSAPSLDVGGGGDFRMPRRSGGRTRGRSSRTVERAPPPPAAAPGDPWVQVKDDASGQAYWWNQETNETTALGEPKPQAGGVVAQAPEQGGGVASGLGRVVAEGFAFGVGSSIARSMVRSSRFGPTALTAHVKAAKRRCCFGSKALTTSLSRRCDVRAAH